MTIPRVDTHFQILVENLKVLIPNYAAGTLMTPVTLGELYYVIQHSPMNKAPDTDLICYEFYRTRWEAVKEDLLAIIDEMYQHHNIYEEKTHGIIICLPKM
jgi:hypothetical protein